MQIIQNARLIPIETGRFGHVSGGLYNEAGQAIAWPLLGSSRANIHKPGTCRISPDQEQPRAIYCGVWFSHFGHFITETLPNLCALTQNHRLDANDLLLFHCLNGKPELPLPSYVLDTLNNIGIDPEQLRWVTQPTSVVELTLSTPAFQKRFKYDNLLKGAIDRAFPSPAKMEEKRVFLSRANLSNGSARGDNQHAIEQVFQDHGFETFSPENYSFEEQRQFLASATMLAGLNGSGLHWSLYCPHMTQVMSLGWKLKLQDGICHLRGQKHVNLPGAGLSRFKGRNQRDLSIDYLERSLAAHLA